MVVEEYLLESQQKPYNNQRFTGLNMRSRLIRVAFMKIQGQPNPDDRQKRYWAWSIERHGSLKLGLNAHLATCQQRDLKLSRSQ